MSEIVVRVFDCHVFHKIGENLEFLMLKRSENRIYPGIWQCVTGKIISGEAVHAAAVRELNEETGLTPHKMWTVDRVSAFYDAENDQMNLLPIFGIEVITKRVILSEEHTDYEWVDYEEGIKRLLWKMQKKGMIELKEMLENDDDRLKFSRII